MSDSVDGKLASEAAQRRPRARASRDVELLVVATLLAPAFHAWGRVTEDHVSKARQAARDIVSALDALDEAERDAPASNGAPRRA